MGGNWDPFTSTFWLSHGDFTPWRAWQLPAMPFHGSEPADTGGDLFILSLILPMGPYH